MELTQAQRARRVDRYARLLIRHLPIDVAMWLEHHREHLSIGSDVVKIRVNPCVAKIHVVRLQFDSEELFQAAEKMMRGAWFRDGYSNRRSYSQNRYFNHLLFSVPMKELV